MKFAHRLPLAFAVLLAPLALAFLIGACRGADPAPTPPAPAGYAPGQGLFFYATGISGTYTVPAGAYVTAITCHASASSATLTLTPSGPGVTSPEAGQPIAIPVGGALTLARPILQGNASELGAGSVIVFTNTDTYLVTLYQGAP